MRVLKKINIKDILFFDIETSTTVKELEIGSPLYHAWSYKKSKDRGHDDDDTIWDKKLQESYKNEAALYPEFGRIVCISVGMLGKDGFKTTTYNNFDEKVMIQDFYNMLDKLGNKTMLCGHAIGGFDINYVAQRGMVNNLSPHDLVDTSGLKPWNVDWILDTKELWAGTSWNKASLAALTTCLGIPTPKDGITGKEVPAYFWKDPKGNIAEISEYCEKDVVACYEIIKHLKNLGQEKEVVPEPEKPKGRLEQLFDGAAYTKEMKEGLLEDLKALGEEEREAAFTVLDAMTSAAKGKVTKVKKTHIKALRKEVLDDK